MLMVYLKTILLFTLCKDNVMLIQSRSARVANMHIINMAFANSSILLFIYSQSQLPSIFQEGVKNHSSSQKLLSSAPWHLNLKILDTPMQRQRTFHSITSNKPILLRHTVIRTMSPSHLVMTPLPPRPGRSCFSCMALESPSVDPMSLTLPCVTGSQK